jgi:hypothetical protein
MPDQIMSEPVGHLHARRIKLPDGRYLIFYTFGEEPQASASETNTARPQAESEPQAAEERSV